MNFLTRRLFSTFSQLKNPLRVAITGATGYIAESLAFRIANGEMFGPDQPVILHLIDSMEEDQSMKAISSELKDCASPLLHSIVCTDDLKTGFADVDAALLIGASPVKKGQKMSDILQQNASVFIPQAQALNDFASRDVRTLVIGSPTNTNCLLLATHAKDIPKQNFAALSRLDLNRSTSMLAEELQVNPSEIQKVVVWGNHSPTVFPDLTWATRNGDRVLDIVNSKWYSHEYIVKVQNRSYEIAKKRGFVSPYCINQAILDQMKSWFLGHNQDWTCLSVWSNGNPYNVPQGLFYSFPVTISNKEWSFVPGLTFNEFQRKMMTVTTKQLLDQRETIRHLLEITPMRDD